MPGGYRVCVLIKVSFAQRDRKTETLQAACIYVCVHVSVYNVCVCVCARAYVRVCVCILFVGGYRAFCGSAPVIDFCNILLHQ
jgi:hypothetical protein